MKNLTLRLLLLGLLTSGIFACFQIVWAEELTMFNGEIRLFDGDFVYKLNDQTYNLSAQPALLTDLAVNFDGAVADFAKLSKEEIKNFLGKLVHTQDKKLLYVFVHNGTTMEIVYPDWQMSLWQIDQINATLPRAVGGQDWSVEQEIQEAATHTVSSQFTVSAETELIRLADLINQERAQYNLPPLRWDEKLSAVAQDKVDEMNRLNYFNHVSPSGLTPGKRLDNFKYTWTKMGENLAKTYNDDATATQVFQLWKNSATHYANIISKDYKIMGLAKSGHFWAQELVSN